MKKLFIIHVFCLLSSSFIFGQTCITFQEMEEHGLSINKLDSLYQNAIHADTVQGPFTGRQQNFAAAWLQFYEGLFKHFTDNGLEWGEPTFCFNKIYFTKTGQIDYWFYNFGKTDNIPIDKQKAYLALITEYSKTHNIEITAQTPFSQCASVTLTDIDN